MDYKNKLSVLEQFCEVAPIEVQAMHNSSMFLGKDGSIWQMGHRTNSTTEKCKLSKIEVPRGYFKDTEVVSDDMITQIKCVNGGLGWLASIG